MVDFEFSTGIGERYFLAVLHKVAINRDFRDFRDFRDSGVWPDLIIWDSDLLILGHFGTPI